MELSPIGLTFFFFYFFAFIALPQLIQHPSLINRGFQGVGSDWAWAQPTAGTTPLNYVCTLLDVIGRTFAHTHPPHPPTTTNHHHTYVRHYYPASKFDSYPFYVCTLIDVIGTK
ncbi:hypothetical protein T492DRAFT_7232 [Pavlovales sp. CCMP2436]|nr:hypothetical protein T492DRAFT_7232 [Pavlovales sp. CCMP2436]